MNPVKVGLLGLGTVGGGTVEVLRRNADEISRRAGRALAVTHACARDLTKPRGVSVAELELVSDPWELVTNKEIDIVCELMGGIEPALDLVLGAIGNGKHVVTANKALIALHGNEIFAAAQAQGVMVAFEAAVAGGIPVIKTLREGLSGNQVEWLAGIINGTCNFILTEMQEHQRELSDVLVQAQQLGYAEADPSMDIDGTDAGHKLMILASIAFGIPLQFERMYIEGISNITTEDVTYAAQLGYRIKHLGIARKGERGIALGVHPTLIPNRRLLANVDGVMNAILVTGDAVGPIMLYGAGAGAEPTASAVVADLVDVVRAMTSDPENRVPHLAFHPDALSDIPILPREEVVTACYLRMNVQDRPGVLADITRILGDLDISIEAIVQKEPAPGVATVPVIILTHRVMERAMNAAMEKIESLESVAGALTRIRMESLA